jgi:calcineurin-like phosphoesterase family protein
MSTVRFIADLHLGHKFAAETRGFDSVEAHDEHVISQWNSVVSNRDTTYILGDVTMEKADSYALLDRLNGVKRVVLGNHDLPKHVPALLKHVQFVSGMEKYKGIFLTHCPIHPMELEHRVSRNIHGHIHEAYVTYPVTLFGIKIFDRVHRRYHCVSCEHVDFIPRTLKELGIER